MDMLTRANRWLQVECWHAARQALRECEAAGLGDAQVSPLVSGTVRDWLRVLGA